MPKRKPKRGTKRPASSNSQDNVDSHALPEETTFNDLRVMRQRAAIHRDVEVESLRTSIRLLKSSLSKEQLQTPLPQFFEENLPNLTVSQTNKNGPIEVKWKHKDGENDGNMISYFLQHMSMANPEFSKAGKMSFIGADNLQMKDSVLEEPSATRILANEDFMQTPGVSSGRLSVGMTPKSARFPKQGEMLLSVHGSPLGVYKENNMDAIQETEEE